MAKRVLCPTLICQKKQSHPQLTDGFLLRASRRSCWSLQDRNGWFERFHRVFQTLPECGAYTVAVSFSASRTKSNGAPMSLAAVSGVALYFCTSVTAASTAFSWRPSSRQPRIALSSSNYVKHIAIISSFCSRTKPSKNFSLIAQSTASRTACPISMPLFLLSEIRPTSLT